MLLKDYLLLPRVTLTIEPGVAVTAQGSTSSLQVDGCLRAIGDSGDPIRFSGGRVAFTQSSDGWNEQAGTGCIIENAIIDQTSISSSGSLKVSESLVTTTSDSSTGVVSVGSSSVISNNTITSSVGRGYGIIVKQSFVNVYGNIISGFSMGIWAAGESTIEWNSILNNGCGIGVGKIVGTSFDSYMFGEVNPIIRDNTIANNYVGIGGPIFNGNTAIGTNVATGETKIERNFITNNTYGLALGAMGSIRKNTIANSLVGISIYDTSAIFSPHMSSNNFENYRQNSIYLSGPKDVTAEENWWGTTDTQSINGSIHDKKTESYLGEVDFIPFLTTANPEAPTAPLTPMPPLPSPSPSPTPSPTLSSNETPDPSIFSVDSNSTVSALAFNSTSLEFSFTVAGPSGTSGYVKAKIAKSLVSNGENIRVYLDGNQLNYEIKSTAESWILTFSYQHSEHQVVIDLATDQGAGTILGIEYWILILVAAVIALTGVIGFVFWRNKKKIDRPETQA